MHIVWYDIRDGNTEIYYKHNPTGNIVGIKNITLGTPTGFILNQNYPNPFNPSTKISFDIPKPAFVKLTVFDILGKEISVLINDELNAGVYNYDWSGINLPTGIYFYKMVSGDFVETKKMILVK